MLSRVAESIYWMSRMIERAENVARFIDVNLSLELDLAGRGGEQWMPLVSTTGDRNLFKERYGEATRANVIQFLTFDRSYPNSIVSCLRFARENARSVRESISSEMWEGLNKFFLMVTGRDTQRLAFETPNDFYGEVKNSSHLFHGIAAATMPRGEGWNFYRAGTLVERADKTSRLLDVKYFFLLPRATDIGTPFDDLQWSAVLRSASALEAYRKQYPRLSPDRVVEFLLLNRSFPRAAHYCLLRAEAALHAISGSPDGTFANPAEQRLGQMRSELAYTSVAEIILGGLHEFLDRFQRKLNQADEGIFETFFTLRPVAARLAYAGSGGY